MCATEQVGSRVASVTEALLQPAPASYDHSVDEREHTVDQWKQLIYQEVREYGGAPPAPAAAVQPLVTYS